MSRVRQEAELRSLTQLVADIEDATLGLADFQRDFDWSDRDARSLLATMLMGWPAGSLLLVRGDTTKILGRPFADGPPTDPRPPRMVLDGQQRLTAVFHALADVGPVVHAINVSALATNDVEGLEDGMRTFPRARWDARFRHSPWVGGILYIPLYALRNSEQFFRFRDIADATQPRSLAQEPDVGMALQSAWRHRLSRLRSYEFPVVLIEPEVRTEVDDASVARIFERVNRTGQRLGAFDLVVARTFTPGVGGNNLRDLWDESRLSDSLIDRWLGDDGLAEDGMPMLQAIALRLVGDVRQSAVLDLEPAVIVDQWQAAVEAVGSAIQFMRVSCGVTRPDWLPYRAMLITLSAVAMDHDLGSHATVVEQWFWTRAFSLRFEAAANTQTGREYVLLGAAIEDGRVPEIHPIRVDALQRATRRRFQAVYRAVLCLIAANKPLDLTGDRLFLPSENLDEVGQASVVASVMLPRPETDLHLRAATMVVVSRETAGRIRQAGLGALTAASPAALSSQLVPTITPVDPQEWIDQRVQIICEHLHQHAGQPLPKNADVEDD
jgi:hypothetical protein